MSLREGTGAGVGVGVHVGAGMDGGVGTEAASAAGDITRVSRGGAGARMKESVLSERGSNGDLLLLLSPTAGDDTLSAAAAASVRGVNSARSPAGVSVDVSACGAAAAFSAPPDATFAIVAAVRGVTGVTSILPPFFRSARVLTSISAFSACSHESICGRCFVSMSCAEGRSQ